MLFESLWLHRKHRRRASRSSKSFTKAFIDLYKSSDTIRWQLLRTSVSLRMTPNCEVSLGWFWQLCELQASRHHFHLSRSHLTPLPHSLSHRSLAWRLSRGAGEVCFLFPVLHLVTTGKINCKYSRHLTPSPNILSKTWPCTSFCPPTHNILTIFQSQDGVPVIRCFLLILTILPYLPS